MSPVFFLSPSCLQSQGSCLPDASGSTMTNSLDLKTSQECTCFSSNWHQLQPSWESQNKNNVMERKAELSFTSLPHILDHHKSIFIYLFYKFKLWLVKKEQDMRSKLNIKFKIILICFISLKTSTWTFDSVCTAKKSNEIENQKNGLLQSHTKWGHQYETPLK